MSAFTRLSKINAIAEVIENLCFQSKRIALKIMLRQLYSSKWTLFHINPEPLAL